MTIKIEKNLPHRFEGNTCTPQKISKIKSKCHPLQWMCQSACKHDLKFMPDKVCMGGRQGSAKVGAHSGVPCETWEGCDGLCGLALTFQLHNKEKLLLQRQAMSRVFSLWILRALGGIGKSEEMIGVFLRRHFSISDSHWCVITISILVFIADSFLSNSSVRWFSSGLQKRQPHTLMSDSGNHQLQLSLSPRTFVLNICLSSMLPEDKWNCEYVPWCHLECPQISAMVLSFLPGTPWRDEDVFPPATGAHCSGSWEQTSITVAHEGVSPGGLYSPEATHCCHVPPDPGC